MIYSLQLSFHPPLGSNSENTEKKNKKEGLKTFTRTISESIRAPREQYQKKEERIKDSEKF